MRAREEQGCVRECVCVSLRQAEKERTAGLFRARICIYIVYTSMESVREMLYIRMYIIHRYRQTDTCLCFLCLCAESGALHRTELICILYIHCTDLKRGCWDVHCSEQEYMHIV